MRINNLLALMGAVFVAMAQPALAQPAFEMVEEPLLVAENANGARATFSNTSALSMGSSADLALGLSLIFETAGEEEQQIMQVSAGNDVIQSIAVSGFAAIAPNTPTTAFSFEGTIEAGYYVMDDGGFDVEIATFNSSDLLVDLKADSKFSPASNEVIEAQLRAMGCVTFTTYTSGDLSPSPYVTRIVYYFHCNDRRSFRLEYTRVYEGPFDEDGPDTTIEGPSPYAPPLGSAQSAQKGLVAPAVFFPDGEPTTTGNQQDIIGYAGFGTDDPANPYATIAQFDDNELVDFFQISERPMSPSGFGNVSVCGHPDQSRYWIAYVDSDGMAVLVSQGMNNNNRNIIELGQAAFFHRVDVACDPWGNAVVSYLTGASGDSVTTVAFTSGGDEVDRIIETLPSGDFIIDISVAMNSGGDVALAFVSFSQGILVSRYQLSGHMQVDGTLSGSFFSPFFNGEGFIWDITEINGVPTLVAYYFTYLPDGSGRQAWLVGSGPINGNRAVITVATGSGARFGDDFDPADVTLIPSGTLTATFLSCGLVEMDLVSSQFGNHRYIAQNLTGLPIAVNGQCSDALLHATQSGSTKAVDASQGGSVFSPSRNGEGFAFDVVRINGQATLVLYYFTYQPDGSGDMAWLVGSAPIMQGMNRSEVEVAFGNGPTFGLGYDPSDVVFTPWGTITVSWLSCGEILVEYDGLWGSGSITLQPLTPPLIGATGNCS